MDALFGSNFEAYAWPALVTVLLLIQYMVFTGLCGAARVKYGVEAPACSGDPMFERAFRVQQNTLEQLATVIPAIWLCALFFRPDVAAIFGFAFFIGRILYRMTYVNDPKKRAPGMIIGFLSCVVLLLSTLWGVISTLI